MQSVSSRIWTRVAVSISYDDNHYATGTFLPYELHRIAYTQSLVMFSTMGGLTQERYLRSVVNILKLVLMLYGPQILCIFCENPFT